MMRFTRSTLSGWLAGSVLAYCSLGVQAEELAPIRIDWTGT
ncbi:hypothetical protein SAMN05660912_00682 [Pseudomonas sp. LAMO17WK12:I1]|jgi:hypothetical protein|nr:hypothetical protein SAMN05660912_00682 [Pseudomonas sp. LAMO17WK12:I1]